MTVYPSGEEILIVGSLACGFAVQVGEPSQFEANVIRPSTSAFGQDAYPTAWEKAAALLHSFATTQTLVDGNKRTAWAACWLLLRLNDAVGSLQGKVDADSAEEFVLGVAAGDKDITEIADGLRRFVQPQLGHYGHLPDGFQLTSSLNEVCGVLLGNGELPDGTRLVYQYMTASDGTPLEIVLTPEQAQEFAEALLQASERNPGSSEATRVSIPVAGFVRHQDIHDFFDRM